MGNEGTPGDSVGPPPAAPAPALQQLRRFTYFTIANGQVVQLFDLLGPAAHPREEVDRFHAEFVSRGALPVNMPRPTHYVAVDLVELPDDGKKPGAPLIIIPPRNGASR